MSLRVTLRIGLSLSAIGALVIVAAIVWPAGLEIHSVMVPELNPYERIALLLAGAVFLVAGLMIGRPSDQPRSWTFSMNVKSAVGQEPQHSQRGSRRSARDQTSQPRGTRSSRRL